MDQEFQIEERAGGAHPVIAVSGEIDVATAPQLRECLHRVIAAGGVHRRARPPGGHVPRLHRARVSSSAPSSGAGSWAGTCFVVVADPRIMKIFEITGLTNVFTIADSLQDAGAS